MKCTYLVNIYMNSSDVSISYLEKHNCQDVHCSEVTTDDQTTNAERPEKTNSETQEMSNCKKELGEF